MLFWVLPCAALTLHSGNAVYFERYFTVQMLFMSVCLTRFILRAPQHLSLQLITSTALCIAIVICTLRQDIFFAHYGRGGFSNVVAFLKNQPENTQVVQTDQYERTQIVASYYATAYNAQALQLLPAQTALSPNWLIISDQRIGTSFEATTMRNGIQFNLVTSYPYYALSGDSWALYKQVDQ